MSKLNRTNTTAENAAIRDILKQQGYKSDIGDVLCNLMTYMRNKQWIGACHATTAIIYIALSELGYKPVMCIGEVFSNTVGYFDHSWIELDGKIIDLSCAMTLSEGRPVNAPVILDVDSLTGKHHTMKYGIYFMGLDKPANEIVQLPLTTYLDSYPGEKNELWKIAEIVLNKKQNIPLLKSAYKDARRKLVQPN